MWRVRINPDICVSLPTVHSADTHFYECSGNTLSDVTQEVQSQSAEIARLKAEKLELETTVKALLDYREWTERIHEDAYDFVFKSGRHREAWNKLMLLTDWFPTPEPEDLSW